MIQSGLKAENEYNPVNTHIGYQKTMILLSKPTLSDSRYDARNHSVQSKSKMVHTYLLT